MFTHRTMLGSLTRDQRTNVPKLPKLGSSSLAFLEFHMAFPLSLTKLVEAHQTKQYITGIRSSFSGCRAELVVQKCVGRSCLAALAIWDR